MSLVGESEEGKREVPAWLGQLRQEGLEGVRLLVDGLNSGTLVAVPAERGGRPVVGLAIEVVGGEGGSGVVFIAELVPAAESGSFTPLDEEGKAMTARRAGVLAAHGHLRDAGFSAMAHAVLKDGADLSLELTEVFARARRRAASLPIDRQPEAVGAIELGWEYAQQRQREADERALIHGGERRG